MPKADEVPRPLRPENALVYARHAQLLELAELRAGRDLGLDDWYELPAYAEALEQAYALGIVDGRLSVDGFDLEAINARPADELGKLPPREVRRYLHALWRCERHTHGYGSPVLDAVRSGAFSMAASKLSACCSNAAG